MQVAAGDREVVVPRGGPHPGERAASGQRVAAERVPAVVGGILSALRQDGVRLAV